MPDQRASNAENCQKPGLSAQLMSLPKESATPSEVRIFLSALMRSCPNFGETDNVNLCEKWTVGGGHELRSYTLKMYQDIFGVQEGWVLYRLVKERSDEGKHVRVIRATPKCRSRRLCACKLED